MIKKCTTILALLFAANAASAGDFDSNQINLKVTNNDYGVEVRTHTNSDRDHIQLERYIDDYTIGYRYDESDTTTEHRLKLDYKAYNSDMFYVTPRLEYRHFEGDADNYTRLRSAFGFKYENAYVEVTPMLHFGEGKTDDFKIDEYQSKIGYIFNLASNTSLNAYIQRDADNDFNKTNMFFGTKLDIRF